MRSQPNRVLVTRATGRASALVRALEAGGAAAVHVPLIAFEPTGAALPVTAPDDLLVLTSATAVEHLDPAGISCPIAAVGPSTRAALEARGLEVWLHPPRALAEALVEALGDLAGRRVVYPRAEVVPPGFEARLRAAGAEVVSVPVYRTVATEVPALPEVEVVTLASGSAARHLARLEHSGRIAAIGPSTARVCRELGLEVAVVADPHTSEGLAAAALSLIR